LTATLLIADPRFSPPRPCRRHSATHDLIIIIIRLELEDRLQPNSGFTLRRVLGVFTRSAITPPSGPIWMKSGALRVHCGGWPCMADFGAIRAGATAGKPDEILFVIYHKATLDLTDFPSAKFYEI